MSATIIKFGLLDMQVCVPKEWDDEKIKAFAESENPSGTHNGWCIRREGNDLLNGDPERTPCDELDGYVHVMLDA
jgi:hypothetical protein